MTRVRLDAIAFDAGTQIRESIKESVVTEYAERMTAGDAFPPVVLFHDGTRYYMADGFHRGLASQRNGLEDIQADVRVGTKDDALWFALGANRTNGHQMTLADKRHAILLAVSTWPDRSMRQIADQVGCSSTYASRIKAEVPTSLQRGERVVGVDGVAYPANKQAALRNREKAANMLRAGRSVSEVRAAVGIGRDTAQQIKREIGVSLDKSRAAVAKRRQDMRDMAARGFTTRQIAAELDITESAVSAIAKSEGIVIHADRAVGQTKRHDANRIIEQMAMDAENLTADVALIQFSELDPERLPEWLKSFTAARDTLGSFIRRLMKERQKYGEAQSHAQAV